jgi:hypothetical protein
MMCWAHSWNGGIEECIQNFGEILLGKFPLESLKRTWENNITSKMDLRKVGCKDGIQM